MQNRLPPTLFRLVFLASVVLPPPFHIPILVCLCCVSEKCGWQGDLGATVKVTYNGDVQTTVANDPSKGFPCNGNTCLNSIGRYIVEGTIEGGTVEYLFEFTATQSTRPSPDMGSRIWLGAGEAAFTGSTTEAPPIPDGARKTTKVQAISAMTGKPTMLGSKGSDGLDKRGYTFATEARLTVLWGAAVMWEGVME